MILAFLPLGLTAVSSHLWFMSSADTRASTQDRLPWSIHTWRRKGLRSIFQTLKAWAEGHGPLFNPLFNFIFLFLSLPSSIGPGVWWNLKDLEEVQGTAGSPLSRSSEGSITEVCIFQSSITDNEKAKRRPSKSLKSRIGKSTRLPMISNFLERSTAAATGRWDEPLRTRTTIFLDSGSQLKCLQSRRTPQRKLLSCQ